MNYIYTWAAARVPPDKREEWDHMMLTPLRPTKKPSAALEQVESDGFMSLYSQAKGEG